MNITAIICEYNPFHMGHMIQLEKIRNIKGKDTAVIALMSGSTVQRGELAIYSKYARAEAAVRCGVNLVLELPCPYCCRSAEYFARGAVSLLDGLGIADSICFGSESGDIEQLEKCADNLMNPEYIEALKLSDSSKSYQRSAEEIYLNMFGDGYPVTPNDILAVEYIKALKSIGSSLEPFTYKRKHGYSATETRKAIYGREDVSALIPKEAQKVFDYLNPTDERLYSAMTLYRIYSASREDLAKISGMNGGVSGYLKNRISYADNLSQLISICTCSKYSASRLKRACLAASLGIKKEDLGKIPLFTNLLACDPKGREILSGIRNKSSVHVITKPSDSRALSSEAMAEYRLSRRSDELFAVSHGLSSKDYLCKKPYIGR